MAIHDDNWTTEFSKEDIMKMSVLDRLLHIVLGIVLLAIIIGPNLPGDAWKVIQATLAGLAGVSAVGFSIYFLWKGITGRW